MVGCGCFVSSLADLVPFALEPVLFRLTRRILCTLSVRKPSAARARAVKFGEPFREPTGDRFGEPNIVQAADRREFPGGTRQKRLVRRSEFIQLEPSLGDRDVFSLCDLDYEHAGDAAENSTVK